jgi:hypothetical protein
MLMPLGDTPTTEHHDLCTKFHSIIEVTRMVVTINHGHATLRKSSVKNKTIEDDLSSSRPLNEILLSVMANILVRHLAEVIAVTVFLPCRGRWGRPLMESHRLQPRNSLPLPVQRH